jgi:hypothetical protein
MTLAEAKDLGAVLGAVLALAALVTGVVEYGHQGAQRRAEHFLEMRKRLKENSTFKEMCALLEVNDPKLLEVPFKEKRDLVGFFEEVALLLNSGLLRLAVTHYMFGYYAILCWESDDFWSGLSRESDYWALFRDFVARMKTVENSFIFRRRVFRF